jgi:RNA polymerase sigma-70 factor (ECF subfamily)
MCRVPVPSAADLDAWVLATAPRATAYARSLVRDPDRADDLVQECYCRLLAKAGVYDLPRDGLKLLLTAITNAGINAATRRRPTFRLTRDDDTPDDPPDPAAAPPDATAAANELSAAVTAALAELPPNQRAAVELKGMGYSQQEIGEVLGVSTSNAGVLIHRGRQAMAEKLAPFLGERRDVSPPVSNRQPAD